MSDLLDTGIMWLFAICKLVEKLPAIIQMMKPLIATLPKGKTLVATTAIILVMLINDFIYTEYYYILPLENPLILGNDFCISYRIILDLV